MVVYIDTLETTLKLILTITPLFSLKIANILLLCIVSRTKREEAERERIMMENIIGEHALADLEKKQAADAAAVARRKAEAEAVHRWHLEQAVKKKQQEEEAVTELRHKMRDRLLASGVPEFQVEAIIDGKRTMPPMNSGGMMPTESSTTYTRMSRKHLSIEALRSRAIEYDLDKVSRIFPRLHPKSPSLPLPYLNHPLTTSSSHRTPITSSSSAGCPRQSKKSFGRSPG